ncbi:serine/threonine-protein kinase [Nonomuraea soli]|uniref:Putative Ser/Thr protein kinase n=1 Tax=Nonomuraea soli TaxID=1032476 RepID=A0A7W0HPJ1_9ACTN|nr:serine/threonine-protein kinase [Nonomuraea soli]MBA2890935.1 putative Ser/Thr protein kinase [Nonomuraea soli]
MQPLVTADPRQLGDYQLKNVLGRGGQGSVYLAEDAGGSRVAIKMLHAEDEASHRRFLREAEAARRVAPFSTARVLDVGVADGRPYIVSEFIPGPSLDELIKAEGPRSGSGLERLAVATLTALAAIHRAGIVHRDLKPSNVIMGQEGPVVIDFGIARALEQTATGSVVGTPAFMAPEQFGGVVGPACDMFSWASTMIYAATGQPAFQGETMPALMAAILQQEPDLSRVPEGLRPLIAACLAKEPSARPRAEVLLARLTGQAPERVAGPQGTRLLTGDLGGGTPGHGAPDLRGAGHGAPDLRGAGRGAPDLRGPGHGGPGRSGPGHGSPGHGSPGHGSPGHGSPGHGGMGHGGPQLPAQAFRSPEAAPGVAGAVAALICLLLVTIPLAGVTFETLRWISLYEHSFDRDTWLVWNVACMAGVILLIPAAGPALWRYHKGATIATWILPPLGVLFLVWALVLGFEDDFPAILVGLLPPGLLGPVLVAVAFMAVRVSRVAAVLGIMGGVLLTVEIAFHAIDMMPGAADHTFRLMRLLATVAARVTLTAWLVALGVMLVRRAAEHPPRQHP